MLGIVDHEFGEYSRNNPTHDVRYFPHDNYDAPRAAIEAAAPGTRTVLVGHSWGGNTAARIAESLGAAGRSVDTLVTIDPVSVNADARLMVGARAGSREWVNVQAVGGGPLERSNIIGRIGGRFGELPHGHADRFIAAPFAHGQFGRLLLAPDASGRSAADAVAGR